MLLNSLMIDCLSSDHALMSRYAVTAVKTSCQNCLCGGGALERFYRTFGLYNRKEPSVSMASAANADFVLSLSSLCVLARLHTL